MPSTNEIITRDEIIEFLESSSTEEFDPEDGTRCIIAQALLSKFADVVLVSVGYDYVSMQFVHSNEDYVTYTNELWMHDWQDALRRERNFNGRVSGNHALDVLHDYPDRVAV